RHWRATGNRAVMPVSGGSATIVLIRHGETDWNAGGRCQGTTDIPLNARGRDQIAQLARQLANVTFDAAFTSPLQRAVASAELVLAERPLAITPVPALAELSYGDVTGATDEAWPDGVRERWARTPWDVAFEGGESLARVHERATPAWDEIVESQAGRLVLVSGHGHVNRVLLLHATRRDRAEFWNIAQPNGHAVVVQAGTVYSLETFLASFQQESIRA
ncbi:MAG: histidine phosphatase family protein, partial [bacterium]